MLLGPASQEPPSLPADVLPGGTGCPLTLAPQAGLRCHPRALTSLRLAKWPAPGTEHGLDPPKKPRGLGLDRGGGSPPKENG